ncbi:MAG: sensor histidine kinase [Actinomycetota bacterium]
MTTDAPPRMPLQRARAWSTNNPFLSDTLVTVLLLTITVAWAVSAQPIGSQRPTDALGIGLILATFAPLPWRRRKPVHVLWLSLAAILVYWVLDYPETSAEAAMLLAVYSVGAHVDRPRSLWHFWGAYATVLLVMLAGIVSTGEDLPVVAIPVNAVILGTLWLLGDGLRNRRKYLEELEEKAALNLERHQAEARRAVTEERTRIARELHDIVAHAMSVMVVQAGAARRVLDDPDRAAEALQAVEQTGRQSLSEMRTLLSVLRSDEAIDGESGGPDMAPTPDLDGIDRLVNQVEEAGLPVSVEVTGDARPLAPGLELSAYRVVQESLTNSLKHAGPATATVTLDYRPDHLRVAVTDDGNGAAAEPGFGQGLIGMRERVEAFGGWIRTGPRTGGGFEVLATFPVEPA